jgi:aryl-alcohol dehydrogenase-like predicted oxidoreductase
LTTKREPLEFQQENAGGNYRIWQGWRLSSIGLGTYLGQVNEQTDRCYREAITMALERGCNVLDAAINYRQQQSEKNIGTVLMEMISKGAISRDYVIVSTKGGFLAHDSSYLSSPARYFYERFVQTGICKAYDLVAGCHCMTPGYLEDQISRSLQNLELDHIDIYFIHNPETQLTEVPRAEFLDRMLAAFQLLERKVDEGKIRIYGTATWNGYRQAADAQTYLSLSELHDVAIRAGGTQHHFRAIQLPYNLAMPEAFLLQNQQVGSRLMTTLEAAQHFGMVVFSSASLLQGKLSRNLPETIRRLFPETTSDAQRAIQFARSTPGVTSALVGMASPGHVRENLEVAKIPPLTADTMRSIFQQ